MDAQQGEAAESFSHHTGLKGGVRSFVYGYRYREQIMAPLKEVSVGASISYRTAGQCKEMRPVVQVSLGCHSRGFACPHPDPKDIETTVAGMVKRAASRPPVASDELVAQLRLFVRKWLKENLIPLSPEADLSFSTWLDQTNYPDWRKCELRKVWEDAEGRLKPADLKCNSFPKDEVYPEYKHARTINSRSDVFKCYVGPIFHAIEQTVYEEPSFIKHVPVKDRPQYIMERLYREGAKYYATDYTAFESLFVPELMRACEFELYAYMTADVPQGQEFIDICNRVLAGENTCRFRDAVMKLRGTRMSGEMCTSLGNGFSNLMFMLFTCDRVGAKNVVGVVEGDDGLFTMVGSPPTTRDFADLGLVIKAEEHDTLSTASFCGIVFDPSERINVTDPRKVLCTFGYTSRQYARARPKKLARLLRSKALSLVHQYPGCPIITALGRYGLRVTNHVAAMSPVFGSSSADTWWHKFVWSHMKMEHTVSLMWTNPGPDTRRLVEKLYGITVEEQVAFERYLDGLNVLEPLNLEPLRHRFFALWSDYAETYGSDQDRFDRYLEFPARQYAYRADCPQEWDSGLLGKIRCVSGSSCFEPHGRSS